MEEYRDPVYSLFRISETGFKFIVVLFLVIIVLGLIAAFTLYRKNLTGSRLMAFGAILIALSVILKYDSTFHFRMPILDFYLMLLGLVLSVIGMCWKNPIFKKEED